MRYGRSWPIPEPLVLKNSVLLDPVCQALCPKNVALSKSDKSPLSSALFYALASAAGCVGVVVLFRIDVNISI
jgi:hypothetical protein